MAIPLRALPFPYVGELRRQGEMTPFRSGVPCAIWPSSGTREAPGGGHRTHEGELPLRYAADMSHNITLHVEGLGSFRIVEWAAQQFLPHVTLMLNQTAPGG
jgi:hypothetical protein